MTLSCRAYLHFCASAWKQPLNAWHLYSKCARYTYTRAASRIMKWRLRGNGMTPCIQKMHYTHKI
eukprot:66756-Amphidinium_carterae.1